MPLGVIKPWTAMNTYLLQTHLPTSYTVFFHLGSLITEIKADSLSYGTKF